jgi:hypothetical protein
MELFQAHNQWAHRPADQRFQTLASLFEATKGYAAKAVERTDIQLSSLKAIPIDNEVHLTRVGSGVTAQLSHWAFGQVAKFAKAPADFLRELPAGQAVDILNLRLMLGRAADSTVNMLFHENGGLLVRAFTSDIYSRIWNYEVVERLLEYEAVGWKPATPTFNTFGGVDAKGLPVEQSTALYASDHDMFAFITHPDRVIKEAGNERGLLRGLIAVNSEVGAAKIKLLKFFYREMCGNHIIWGAEDVVEMSARHVGNVRSNFALWQAEVRRYMDSSVADDEAKIERAQRKLIAGTKDEVLDALFGKRQLQLSRKTLEAGYAAVDPKQDGDPKSYWGFAQGLTRHSQTIPYADQRTQLDVAAGKVLALAF